MLAELAERPLVHVGVERVDRLLFLRDVSVERGQDTLGREEPEAFGGEVHRIDFDTRKSRVSIC